LAERYVRDLGRALAVAGRLESAGLRPNVVRTNPGYTVYIATADLLRLAEGDGEIRRGHSAVSRRKGRERHAEAEGNSWEALEKTSPFPYPSNSLAASSKPASLCVSRY
jgi:hypothetical protein